MLHPELQLIKAFQYNIGTTKTKRRTELGQNRPSLNGNMKDEHLCHTTTGPQ